MNRNDATGARRADDETGPVASGADAPAGGTRATEARAAAAHSPAGATATTDGRASASGAAGGGTGALASSPRTRDDALRRLRKIEGQVRGLQRMVEGGRYCADVLTQIASVQQALRAVGKVLMRTHLEHCITEALRSGDAVEAERVYGEVLDLMYRHAK